MVLSSRLQLTFRNKSRIFNKRGNFSSFPDNFIRESFILFVMAKNVSDQLVEMLVDAGVKRVYAITGDSLNPVNDAIRRDGRISWIHVRHEESAAYAASMDAELHGIGCCMGSSGPDTFTLSTGFTMPTGRKSGYRYRKYLCHYQICHRLFPGNQSFLSL